MKNKTRQNKHTEGTSSTLMDLRGNALEISPSCFKDAIITYQISRYEIENCITERIVQDLRAEPGNPLIRCQMDSVIFSVEGYDHEPRELFMVPEFRRYIQKIDEHKPAWIYYATLESHWLPMVALCLVKNANAVTDIKMQSSKLSFPGKDLSDFIQSQLDPFFALCEMAGVAPKDAEGRVQAVCRSFGMHHNGE